jgi:hypothetical protein
MPNPARRGRDKGGDDDADRDDRGHDRDHEHEPWDDPSEHLEIERRRFAGGLPPTPELYALAREQWYQLAGVLTRPSMDPVTEESPAASAQPPDETHPGESEPGQ